MRIFSINMLNLQTPPPRSYIYKIQQNAPEIIVFFFIKRNKINKPVCKEIKTTTKKRHFNYTSIAQLYQQNGLTSYIHNENENFGLNPLHRFIVVTAALRTLFLKEFNDFFLFFLYFFFIKQQQHIFTYCNAS